jgi:hypothetical protein
VKTEAIMPRPTSKKDLLSQAQTEFHRLELLLGRLTEHDFTEQLVTSRWTTKDVLAHLTEWQQMALGWYECGLKNETPALPAQGYNWRQIPELNQVIYLKHKDQPLNVVLERFQHSHQEIMVLLEQLSQIELFEPGHFLWTKKNNLATYMISATSSHYKWAHVRIHRKFKSK